ncbi:hypothetical protein ACMGGR_19560 [Erwinia sp. BNK-24-b]|uniref:hypothetical protein n=1 Tax=Erwinia TaxID=551 RepID=UPI001FEDC50E|nr:hypothetical protein [Erwinia phyllosphaerae]MBV4368510.1 hypothetical protein [Erwinia phyllosphaerae]
MKEISVMEMAEVSGAYSWDFTDVQSFMSSLASNTLELFGAATVGATMGGATGALIGGKHGGDGGGIFGLGIVGQGIGMIGAGIIGSICFGLYGAVVGWETINKAANTAIEGMINGTIG